MGGIKRMDSYGVMVHIQFGGNNNWEYNRGIKDVSFNMVSAHMLMVSIGFALAIGSELFVSVLHPHL